MAGPFAFIIRLIAAPSLSSPEPGVVHARMGFLRVLGRRSGEIPVLQTPEQTAEQWIAVIGRLLPPLRAIRYATGAGRVELLFDPPAEGNDGDEGNELLAAVQRLVNVALDEAGRFLRMDRDELDAARETLMANLNAMPIDMREPGSEKRLRELLGRLR